jgi:hypothetical protein
MGRLASYDYGDIILQCARSEASRVHKGGRGTSEWKVDRQVANSLVGYVLEESVGGDEQPAHERAWPKSDWLHKAGAEERFVFLLLGEIDEVMRGYQPRARVANARAHKPAVSS